MKWIYTTIVAFFLGACSASSQPYGQMEYIAVSSLAYNSKISFKDIVKNVCQEKQCEVLGEENANINKNLFLYVVKVNKNEEIWFNGHENKTIQLTIVQKKKGKIDNKTIQLVQSLRGKVKFDLIVSEEWICSGSDLTYENCTKKTTEYPKIDLFDFIIQIRDKK